jgi:hypothetical protein
MLHIRNTDTLRSIYFAYVHSLMKYGIIFWGKSSDSKKVFVLQKKIVRIVMGVKSHNSCRDLFKRLEILTLPCEYIFSLINLIRKNQVHFQTNADVHSVNTRNKHHLHRPTTNLSPFQKSAYYAGTKFSVNSVDLVRERTILTDRPPLVGEVSAIFADRECHVVSTADSHGR